MISSHYRLKQKTTPAEQAIMIARSKDKVAPCTICTGKNPIGQQMPETCCTFQTQEERLAACGTVWACNDYAPDCSAPMTWCTDNAFDPDRTAPTTFCSLFNP